MKHNILFSFAIGLVCLNAWCGTTVLDSFEGMKLPDSVAALGKQLQVNIMFDPKTSTHGRGSILIFCNSNETASAMIFTKPLSGNKAKDRVLWLTANWKSDSFLDSKAYLEMLVTTPDGNTYFSRGLETSQVLAGKTDWRTCRIPFFLKKGEVASSVKAGVRFERMGKVWLDTLTLTEETDGFGSSFLGSPGFLGMMGGLIGGLMGVWGSIAGVLAQKGKGKTFVLVSGLVLVVFSVLLLIAGIVLLITGAPWMFYYPCILVGLIGTTVLGGVLASLMTRYRRMEMQRMQMLDQLEDL